MGVISIRLPQDVLDAFTKRGVKPSALAKSYLLEEAKRMAVEEHLQFLSKHRVQADKPSLEIIKELRNERDRRLGL